MQSELSLKGSSITDIHLTPQPPTSPRQLDLYDPVIGINYVAVPSDPPLLFEAIEPPTQARRRQP